MHRARWQNVRPRYGAGRHLRAPSRLRHRRQPSPRPSWRRRARETSSPVERDVATPSQSSGAASSSAGEELAGDVAGQLDRGRRAAPALRNPNGRWPGSPSSSISTPRTRNASIAVAIGRRRIGSRRRSRNGHGPSAATGARKRDVVPDKRTSSVAAVARWRSPAPLRPVTVAVGLEAVDLDAERAQAAHHGLGVVGEQRARRTCCAPRPARRSTSARLVMLFEPGTRTVASERPDERLDRRRPARCSSERADGGR